MIKWRYALFGMFLLAVVYPLSVGPYAWLDNNGFIDYSFRPVIDPGFEGVEMIAECSQPTDELFRGYLALWLGGSEEAETYIWKRCFIKAITSLDREAVRKRHSGWTFDY